MKLLLCFVLMSFTLASCSLLGETRDERIATVRDAVDQGFLAAAVAGTDEDENPWKAGAATVAALLAGGAATKYRTDLKNSLPSV